VFSIIVLGLAGNFTATTQSDLVVTFPFSALAVATAVISLVTLPVLLIVDVLRNGAFTSMIVVELPWLFFLCVLWLATAADTAQFNSLINSDCNDYYLSVVETSCHEFKGIEGFAFLLWMLLMVYSIIVLVMAIIGSSRGHKTWTNSIKNANFLGPAEGGAVPLASAQPAPPQPTMQQHQYPPSNSPSQGYTMPPIPPVSPYYGTQGSHGSQLPSSPNSPSQGYAMPSITSVSPYHGTQGSHGSQLPPREYVQGPAYV